MARFWLSLASSYGDTLRRTPQAHPSASLDADEPICGHRCRLWVQQWTFVSSCISDPAAHARPEEAAPGTPTADDLLLASSCQRQRTEFGIQASPISRPESIPTP